MAGWWETGRSAAAGLPDRRLVCVGCGAVSGSRAAGWRAYRRDRLGAVVPLDRRGPADRQAHVERIRRLRARLGEETLADLLLGRWRTDDTGRGDAAFARLLGDEPAIACYCPACGERRFGTA